MIEIENRMEGGLLPPFSRSFRHPVTQISFSLDPATTAGNTSLGQLRDQLAAGLIVADAFGAEVDLKRRAGRYSIVVRGVG